MSIQGTSMEINGLNLNVLVEGEGAPVLLLHGQVRHFARVRVQVDQLLAILAPVVHGVFISLC